MSLVRVNSSELRDVCKVLRTSDFGLHSNQRFQTYDSHRHSGRDLLNERLLKLRAEIKWLGDENINWRVLVRVGMESEHLHTLLDDPAASLHRIGEAVGGHGHSRSKAKHFECGEHSLNACRVQSHDEVDNRRLTSISVSDDGQSPTTMKGTPALFNARATASTLANFMLSPRPG